MELYLRSGIWWFSHTHLKQRIRDTLGTGDKRQATKLGQEALAQIVAGTYCKRSGKLSAAKKIEGMTLSKAFDRAVKNHWGEQKDLKSKLYRSRRMFADLGEDTLLKSISTDVIAEWREKMLEEVSLATVNRHLSLLSPILKFAHTIWNELDSMPYIKFAKEKTRRIRVFTKEEEIAQLQAASPEMQILITLLIHTGCRRAEALNLEWQDVDLKAKRAFLAYRKVTGTDMSIPLLDPVVLLLESIPDKTGKVVKLGVRQAECQWDKLRETLGHKGDEGYIMHTWRHTCAVRMLEEGNSIYDVQQWLGHTDIKTTLRYAKMTTTRMDAITARRNQALKQPTGNLTVLSTRPRAAESQ